MEGQLTDMRKIFLSFLILCLCTTSALANPSGFAGAILRGSGGATADSCIGDLLFSWHMENADVTLGTPSGCSVGDTTATLNSGAVLDAALYQDGARSGDCPTSNDYFGFTVSSEDLVRHVSGTVDVWIYVDAFGEGAAAFYAGVDSSNRVMVTMQTVSTFHQFRITHIAGGTGRTVNTTISGGFLNATWYHVVAKWDETAHNGNYLSICADTNTGSTNCGGGTTALGIWTGTLTLMRVGEGAVVTSDSHVDNVKVYGVWR